MQRAEKAVLNYLRKNHYRNSLKKSVPEETTLLKH